MRLTQEQYEKLKAKKSPRRKKSSIPSNLYKPNESQIGQSFVDYVHKVFPQLRYNVIKIDNEGKTSWALGKQKKKEGKLKGASDYFIAVPTKRFHGLWLEIKTRTGKESPEQKRFGMEQMKKGYQYAVAHSIDEAIGEINYYLGYHGE